MRVHARRDPEKLKAGLEAFATNPALKGLADSIPGMREMLEDPEKLSEQAEKVTELMSSLQDPEKVQELLGGEGGEMLQNLQKMMSGEDGGEGLQQMQQVRARARTVACYLVHARVPLPVGWPPMRAAAAVLLTLPPVALSAWQMLHCLQGNPVRCV